MPMGGRGCRLSCLVPTSTARVGHSSQRGYSSLVGLDDSGHGPGVRNLPPKKTRKPNGVECRGCVNEGGDVGSLVWSLHQPHLSIVCRQRQVYKTQGHPGGKVLARNILLVAEQDVRVLLEKAFLGSTTIT